jgi:D-alanyl-D-alanine carboxypeptidase/D-alanyl-D-alanine-endopeptidase (penicillin-binding protein 4)
MYPENNYVQIVNNINTEPIGSLTNIYPQKEINSNLIYLQGVIAQDTSKKIKPYNVSVTIDNPTRFFLHLFKDALARRTIRFRGAIFDINDWFEKVSYIDKSPVCEYESPSLIEIVSVINKHSHNLSAEMLLKTIGKEMSGEGSAEKGISYLKRFAAKVGMDPENISVVDGSGLSRYNMISPDYLVTLLARNRRLNDSMQYQKTLAIPGKPGTLARRMTKTHAETRTFGKTGTLNNVSNLVAYVISRDDEVFGVAIMVMNFITPSSIAENLQDLICMRLASFSRKRE